MSDGAQAVKASWRSALVRPSGVLRVSFCCVLLCLNAVVASVRRLLPQGDLSSMIASMEALTVALNTKQNQGTKTEGKEVRFEAGEEELGVAYFGMVEVPEAPSDALHRILRKAPLNKAPSHKGTK